VDLFGLPADYDIINAIARENDLFVLEDACQSFGAEYKGKKACNLADCAATSFFPAKPLGCYGDGGAVFTNDEELNEIMCSLRVHGQGSNKYENVRIGINGRLDTLQAAILLAKMEVFAGEIEMRQRVASRYSDQLKGFVTAPNVPDAYVSAWAQYSVLTDSREDILAKLKEAGIPTAIYYPKPLHVQTAFAHLRYSSGCMSISEDCARNIFSVPMHPYLSIDDQGYISNVISGAA
jgi:UDP-2-acetamido-2-deoxy-ribo-hexuluronate aminotransferase